MTDQEEVDIREVVKLGAVDSGLFYRTFFSRTARLPSPPMHEKIDEILDSTDRYINILMSRGWAKTSKLRMFSGKRIAYGVSRTILYVGASEKHTRRSIRWVRNQIDHNRLLADTFQLRPGVPWTDEEACILHGIEENRIWITGVGITSSSGRGINFDDYRPDLIIMDDVMNDENSATKEGREKIIDLVFGAFKESLAPRSESPLAKLVMLNTPQDNNDISQLATKDRQFTSARFGCWTKDTEDLPLEERQSAWPELISTQELQEEYRAAAARNRLSIFIREKECRLISSELAAFKEEWIEYFGLNEDEPEPPLNEMFTILVIDPTPPPSEIALAKGLIENDYEAMTVLGRYRGKIYVLESVYHKGHDPNWTTQELFRLGKKWRVRKVLVEAVVFSKTVVWYLREQMRKTATYFLLEEFGADDRRAKFQKIIDGITGVASNHQLYFRRAGQEEALAQFRTFSTIKKIGHDDVLETIAIGCTELMNKGLNYNGATLELSEDEYEDLSEYRGAP